MPDGVDGKMGMNVCGIEPEWISSFWGRCFACAELPRPSVVMLVSQRRHRVQNSADV